VEQLEGLFQELRSGISAREDISGHAGFSEKTLVDKLHAELVYSKE
jgi:hypothetical protein